MSSREHTTDENDGLEALLAAHLRERLGGQVGRAEAAFAAEVGRESPRRSMRLGMWGLWVAGAMAASMGIVWGVAAHRVEPSKKNFTQVSPTSSESELAMVGAVTQYQTIDEGAVTVQNAGPARRVRREVVETVQWHDPQTGAEIEVTVPHEQVVFVGMPAF
jgi:hypothetical protein